MSNSTPHALEDNVPICPPWWPHSLWALHFPNKIIHPPGPGPINLPADVNQVLLNLQVYTTSYLIADQTAAKQMRKFALEQLEAGVRKLAGSQ